MSITGRTEDEKQVWQTLGVGNEDCVEWVVCCACLNLLDDEILRAAEKRANPNASGSSSSPASTLTSPASTAVRPVPAPLQRVGPAPGPRSASAALGPGIASSAPASTASMQPMGGHPAMNLAQTYRQNPPPMRGPPARPGQGRPVPQGYASAPPAGQPHRRRF